MIEGGGLRGAACAPDAWNGNMLSVKAVVDLFYADPVDEPERVAHAVEICDRCPVREECLETYINERHGVWGGLTEVERHALRKERRNARL